MKNNDQNKMENQIPNQPMPNQPNMMNMRRESQTKISAIVGYIAAIVMAVAIFMPYLKYSGFGEVTLNYFKDGSGSLILSLAIISAILIFIKKHMIVVFPSIISLVEVIKAIVVISGEDSYTIGMAVWFVLIGSIVLLISAFLYWKENPDCLKGIIEFKPRYQYGYMNQPMLNQMTNQNPNVNNNQQ